MAILLPDGLPAAAMLRAEGIEVRHERHPGRAAVRVGLLNLMPDKTTTETQFARLLGRSAREVELLPMRLASHRCRSASAEHLARFYRPWEAVAREGLDGLIVTGAPVELMPFASVDYWLELCRALDWARVWARNTYYVCWAAQAALYRFHGVGKRPLSAKRFGVFAHRVTAPASPLAKNLPAHFPVPVSRHTESCLDETAPVGVAPVAVSDEAGICLAEDRRNRATYAFNHFEYDADTLAREYRRDLAAGEAIRLPQNYFPGDDPKAEPMNGWHGAAARLFENWLGLVDPAVGARPEARPQYSERRSLCG
jgi:homoserine O-succinyltransferase